MVILPSLTYMDNAVSDRDGRYWNAIAMLLRCNNYAFRRQ